MAQEENEMARSFVVQPNSLFLYELPLPVPSQLAYQTILFRCCNSGRCGLNDATIVNSCKDDKNRGCCSKMVENTFSISRNSNRYPIFYLTILLSFSFVFTFYTQDLFIFDKNRFRDYSFNTERMVS